MNLDAWIEQLAFGRSLPKLSSCLGLYLGPEVLYLSEAALKEGRPRASHLLRIPVPQPGAEARTATGALSTEILADVEKWAALLRPALSQVQWTAKHLVVSLSGELGLLRYFVMPAIDRRFWKTAVPAESKKYIPIPFNDLVHDFQVVPVLPGPERRPQQGVVFCVTHARNLEGIKSLAEKLGLALLGVEMAACSAERLWSSLEPKRPPPPYAQLHFGEGKARILLSERGLPVFFREISVAGDGTVVDRRRFDLPGCIEFARKQLGARKPEEVRLSGEVPDPETLRASIAQDTGLPVRMQDATKALGIKGGEWGGLASIGAASRLLVATPLRLDLSHTARVSEEDRKVAFSLFALAAAVAALLALLGGARALQLALRSSELHRLRQPGRIAVAFQGKSSAEVEKEIQEMEARGSSLYAMTGSRLRLARVLEYVAEGAPEGLWVDQIAYQSQLGEASGSGGPLRRSLALRGGAMGASPAAEQDLALQFRDNLERDERFNKLFSCRGGAVQTDPAANPAAAPQGAHSRQMEELRERRTTFTIECAGKQR